MCVDARVWVHAYMPELVYVCMLLKINVYFLPSLFLGHAVPRWRMRLHLDPYFVGILCVLSILVASTLYVTLIVQLLSLNRAMSPAHTCMHFLKTSTMSVTPVWCRNQVLRLCSRRVMRSRSRCASDSRRVKCHTCFVHKHVRLCQPVTY